MKVYVKNRYDLLHLKSLMKILLRDFTHSKIEETENGFKVRNLGENFECELAEIEKYVVKEIVNDEAQDKLGRIMEILDE